MSPPTTDALRAARHVVSAIVLAGVAACGPPKPPNWDAGGARMPAASARWDRAAHAITIEPDGTVRQDGAIVFYIDAGGRIFDAKHDPLAIISPYGEVIDKKEEQKGILVTGGAMPPKAGRPWFFVHPNGNVELRSRDGRIAPDGRWHGCSQVEHRTCVAVTHVVLLRDTYEIGSVKKPAKLKAHNAFQVLELLRFLELFK